MGTVKYMSPELARGIAVDAHSDIFTLGSVIYEMITGRAPFQGDTASDVIHNEPEFQPLMQQALRRHEQFKATLF